MSFYRSGSGISSTAPDESIQNRVHERIQGWENRADENHQLGAGFEQGRPTPIVQTADEFDQLDLQQRQDAIHQLWFQSARDRIFEIGRLEKENQSLKEHVMYGTALDEEVEKLTEQLEESNAEIDELLAEKQLVVEPYCEELESEVEFLRTSNKELSVMTAAKDQAINSLALENESLRRQLCYVNGIAGLRGSEERSLFNESVVFDQADETDKRTEMEQASQLKLVGEQLEETKAAAEQLSIAKEEQALELQDTKRLLSIARDDLKNTRCDLEIAKHHLQLRRESIAIMEESRRKSSVTGVSLFEAEAHVRNDLEIQRDNLESELRDTRTRQEDLDNYIEVLRFNLYDSSHEQKLLQKRLTNFKLQSRYLAIECSNLENALANLRRCFDSAKEEIQEKDAKITDLECELQRQSGMIVTLSGALSTARQQQEEKRNELKRQTLMSRIRGELLQKEKQEHGEKKLELEHTTEQLDQVRANLTRAQVIRSGESDKSLADNRFLELQLQRAEETIGRLNMQLDMTQNQLSREQELRCNHTDSIRNETDGSQPKDRFRNRMRSVNGNRNGMVGSAFFGDALNGILSTPSD